MDFEGYEASTHIPILRAVVREYNPLFILELGIGIHSTPHLVYSRYVGIENDPEWIARVKKLFPDIEVIYHQTDLNIGTNLKEITPDKEEEIASYYRSLNIPDLHPNFLFVDNYVAFRTLAITELKDRFDIIAYHDCQAEGVEQYQYYRLNKEGFNSYCLKSPTSWTCLMVRSEIDKGRLDLPIAEYLKDWPDCKFLKYE
jgi:hypothetical protein